MNCRRHPFPPLIVLAATAALPSCNRQPPAQANVSADSGVVRSAPADAAEAADAAANAGALATLELVAVGTKPGAKIVWLRANGQRVWLSGMGLDAYADGDGPLAGAPDLLKSLSYTSEHRVLVEGIFPQLFAFRRKNVPPGPYVDEAAVFVRQGSTWKQAPGAVPEEQGWPPHAFVAWNGGALLVDSQAENLGWAMSGTGGYRADRPGTTFRYVAPDAGVTRPSLGLDPTFMAWGASSDGTTLSLIGTYGIASSDTATGSRDVVVMRGKEKGAFEASVIVSWRGPGSLRTSVRECGSAALVLPPPVRDNGTLVSGAPAVGGDERAWKGNASRLFVVAGGKVEWREFRSADQQDCSLDDAALVGGDIYAIVSCTTKNVQPWLVHIDADRKRERLALPALVSRDGGYRVADAGDAPLPCRPKRIVARPPDDLWIQAECGGESAPVPAVFRQGHPQEAILVP